MAKYWNLYELNCLVVVQGFYLSGFTRVQNIEDAGVSSLSRCAAYGSLLILLFESFGFFLTKVLFNLLKLLEFLHACIKDSGYIIQPWPAIEARCLLKEGFMGSLLPCKARYSQLILYFCGQNWVMC